MSEPGLADDSFSSPHPNKTKNRSDSLADGTSEALPKVQTLPNTATVDEVVNALKLAGGVIIKDAVAHEDLDQIEKDVRPLLEADAPWTGGFFPPQTRRCYGLLARSPTFAAKVILHPLYQAASARFLTTRNWFWQGSEKITATSPPQISNTVAFSVRPGAAAQPLHRDDWCHHAVAAAVSVYPDDLQARGDTGLGIFVAATRATRDNGCTRFIPGSHLWAHGRAPDEGLCVPAALARGDAFVMLASCYHGGGANATRDEERLLLSCFMTRGWLRQEENHYLNMSVETARGLPLALQKVAGYDISEPFLGWVDAANPRVVLDPSIQGGKDMVGDGAA